MDTLNNQRTLNMQILLVEDCPDQQRMLVTLLSKMGADVTLECNGKAAYQMIIREPKKFDLIVMDFLMPLTDGLKATQQIRGAGCTVPILAITAHHSTELESIWRENGCNHYLQKPIKASDLISAVDELVPARVRAEGLAIPAVNPLCCQPNLDCSAQ